MIGCDKCKVAEAGFVFTPPAASPINRCGESIPKLRYHSGEFPGVSVTQGAEVYGDIDYGHLEAVHLCEGCRNALEAHIVRWLSRKEGKPVKLTDVIAIWDKLHVKDTGELGFCDLDAAVEEVVGVEDDVPTEMPQ